MNRAPSRRTIGTASQTSWCCRSSAWRPLVERAGHRLRAGLARYRCAGAADKSKAQAQVRLGCAASGFARSPPGAWPTQPRVAALSCAAEAIVERVEPGYRCAQFPPAVASRASAMCRWCRSTSCARTGRPHWRPQSAPPRALPATGKTPKHQHWQFKLAERTTEIENARNLYRKAALRMDSGTNFPEPEPEPEAATAHRVPAPARSTGPCAHAVSVTST